MPKKTRHKGQTLFLHVIMTAMKTIFSAIHHLFNSCGKVRAQVFAPTGIPRLSPHHVTSVFLQSASSEGSIIAKFLVKLQNPIKFLPCLKMTQYLTYQSHPYSLRSYHSGDCLLDLSTDCHHGDVVPVRAEDLHFACEYTHTYYFKKHQS